MRDVCRCAALTARGRDRRPPRDRQSGRWGQQRCEPASARARTPQPHHGRTDAEDGAMSSPSFPARADHPQQRAASGEQRGCVAESGCMGWQVTPATRIRGRVPWPKKTRVTWETLRGTCQKSTFLALRSHEGCAMSASRTRPNVRRTRPKAPQKVPRLPPKDGGWLPSSRRRWQAWHASGRAAHLDEVGMVVLETLEAGLTRPNAPCRRA